MRPPASIDAYFADPFILQLTDGTYVAYGSADPTIRVPETLTVCAYHSLDLIEWECVGPVLEKVDPALGDSYWAPEVIFHDSSYWMFYSVGHGIHGHHLRIASATSPFGPFHDLGVNLTPGEAFAIDPHPFRAENGELYLYFARDVLDSDRPGTHLAVMAMESPTTPRSAPVEVLAPTADWQIYQRGREMYGETYDWHTLEGPSVVYRHDRYWMTYSGGAWTGADYAVSWASSRSPDGPWTPAPIETVRLLYSTPEGFTGPGHNSLVRDPTGRDVIAFHSWDENRTARHMHLNFITFGPDEPRIGGPIRGSSLHTS